MNLHELFEAVNASDLPDELKGIFADIKRDCKPWLHEAGGKLIYRGMSNYDESDLFRRLSVRKNRVPKDTNKTVHDTFNAKIKERFGMAARSETLFVTGDKQVAQTYGTMHIIFPIGKFRYLSSADIADLFTVIAKDYDHNSKLPVPINYRYMTMRFDKRLWNKIKPLIKEFIDDNETLFTDEINDRIQRISMQITDNDEKLFKTMAGVQYAVDEDLFNKVNELNDKVLDIIIKSYSTNKEALPAAIKKGNEIMILCDEYYAIDLSLLSTKFKSDAEYKTFLNKLKDLK